MAFVADDLCGQRPGVISKSLDLRSDWNDVELDFSTPGATFFNRRLQALEDSPRILGKRFPLVVASRYKLTDVLDL